MDQSKLGKDQILTICSFCFTDPCSLCNIPHKTKQTTKITINMNMYLCWFYNNEKFSFWSQHNNFHTCNFRSTTLIFYENYVWKLLLWSKAELFNITKTTYTAQVIRQSDSVSRPIFYYHGLVHVVFQRRSYLTCTLEKVHWSLLVQPIPER